jgi:hypothetical protein
MKFENTFGIRKSMDGSCALATSCFPASNNKRAVKKAWIEGKDLYLGNISGIDRVLVAVHYVTDHMKTPMMMDAVTGSLFKIKDGRCKTSDSLRMKNFTKAEGLAERLIAVKSEQYADSGESE